MGYKKLEQYIQPINSRNKDLKVERLLGVSIRKVLMPSIANTVGTNMKTYKIIKKHQFAYGPVTSRNGDKISIALLEESEEAIISQAYTVFEVIDTKILDSEYLMMWFRRPEFDRYTRFKSHGSARETFDWGELCEIELPIPSIEKQQAIVKEYNTVVNRIQLNETLNQKLEETAQALYKDWFLDFEFPNKEGKPYKSSGGEMVFNEGLDMEIPILFLGEKMDNHIILSQGIQVGTDLQFVERKGNQNRFLRIIDYTAGTDELPRFVSITDERYFCTKDEVIMIRYGDAGTVCRRLDGVIANNLFKVSPITLTNNFLYYYLKDDIIQNYIKKTSGSSTMPAITHGTIKELITVIPTFEILAKFDSIIYPIESQIVNLMAEVNTLKELKFIVLSKMSKIEVEKEMV